MGNRRGLVVLLVIFMGLVGVYLLQQSQIDQAVDTALAPTPTIDIQDFLLFPETSVVDIVAVTLREPNTNATFTIVRAADGTWTAPDETGTLDADAATLVARTIVLTPFERVIEVPDDASADYSQYGFRPNGELFIQFLLTDETAHVVAVGGLTGDRAFYYALVDERPGVYLVPRGPIDFLIQTLINPPVA